MKISKTQGVLIAVAILFVTLGGGLALEKQGCMAEHGMEGYCSYPSIITRAFN